MCDFAHNTTGKRGAKEEGAVERKSAKNSSKNRALMQHFLLPS